MVKKGSCLKRLAIGCGGFLALVVALGLVASIAAFTGKADPPEFTKIQSAETFPAIDEGTLDLSGGNQTPGKPIRLILDMRMLEFHLKAHDAPGQFRIEGEYDKANYELTTLVKEKKDSIEYRVGFKNRHNILGLLAGADGEVDPEDNKIVVYAPRDQLLELKYKIDIGTVKLELTGLAVKALEGHMSKGPIFISMEEPNKTRMAVFDLKNTMSEMTLWDVQNYRYKEGHVQGNAGTIRLDHSGLYKEDARLVVRMAVGEVLCRKPANTNFNPRLSTIMGGIQNAKEEPFLEDRATFTLAGRVSVGEFKVTNNSVDKRVSRLYSKLKQGDTDQVLADYKSHIALRPSKALTVDDLNTLARWLWHRQLEDKTYAVFALNEELHPDNPDVFKGQGRFYKRNKMYKKALASFETALEKDPGDEASKQQLARLKHLIKEQEVASN